MTLTGGTAGDPLRSSDQSLTIMVGAMAGALVIIGVVLALVGAELATPPLWMLLVVAAATAGAWATAVLAPVPRPAAAGAPPSAALQPLVLMRAALLEAPALLGMALALFTEPTNLTVYVLPALFAVGGMWLFARPATVRARLERDHPAGQTRP